MNPARGTCGPTCMNQARVTARCSTSWRSTGVASYTRMSLHGSTPGSAPRTGYCAGSAVWCVVAIVRPQQAAGSVPANADRPLPAPLPPHPHLLLLLLPPKILPSSPELRATPKSGKVPFLPPKLIKTRISPPRYSPPPRMMSPCTNSKRPFIPNTFGFQNQLRRPLLPSLTAGVLTQRCRVTATTWWQASVQLLKVQVL